MSDKPVIYFQTWVHSQPPNSTPYETPSVSKMRINRNQKQKPKESTDPNPTMRDKIIDRMSG